MKRKIFLAVLLFLISASTGGLFAQAQKPVDPVNWRELVPFLIDIAGYEAEKPEGTTTAMAEFKLSQVSREYTKGESSLEIEIIDGSYIPLAYASFQAMQAFEVDSSEELIRKVTIQGFPAIEHMQFEDKEATLMILVAERFLVNLRGENYENTSEVKAVSEKLDLKRLASLAK